ncbi:hypothetical protein UA08_09514 [Talaromyces atroroseus]|uniref:chitinase n=1 Tax=Talaromyces atroroseus TaxID=1441469 RepID=A0A1Q5Q5W8_TALAT|nr:hypothetical protein UA08_09514 [Talaromyces atroroseus]OKL55218.1 hypothetical protein UA08_09514 [Talaromyces atroroseus]
MRFYSLGISCLMAAASCVPAVSAAVSDDASNAAAAFLSTKSFETLPAPASVETPNRAAIKAALLAGNYTSPINSTTRSRCPSSCSKAGVDSSDWFAYHSVGRLNLCNETMLLDFSLLSDFESPGSKTKISACTADLTSTNGPESNITTCNRDDVNYTEVTSSLQMISSGTSSAASLPAVSNALAQLQAFSSLSNGDCNERIYHAYSTEAAVGVYVGSNLAPQGVIDSVLDQLSTALENDGSVPTSVAVQLCDDNGLSRYSLGVFISTEADLSTAQNAVQTWKNGSCLTTMEDTVPAWQNITFLAPSIVHHSSNSSVAYSNVTSAVLKSRNKLLARDTCSTIQVQSGDTSTSLATECGITAEKFIEYNPNSTLATGENVCCSAESLPHFAPQQDSNGTCYSYTVVSGDLCSTLAATYDITVDDIETWNNETWGWTGCTDLIIGDLICLSSGYPPMPAPIANAECGPQVPNTPTAPVGSNFSTLNECPLNACCDIWGECGTTAEFCTISYSSTGNPGTAAKNQNGCISNCGTDIITSTAPARQYTIAYFEGFNWQRPCLNGGVQTLNTSAYTHVHMGFATINPDWSINTTDIDPQLPYLEDLQGVKKILSIGGWSFCTDPSTYMIFRDVVASESSRSTLVNNIVTYMNDNNLDGVDIDWEYPDEPDFPGIPAGTPEDSTGYFLLLEQLKEGIAANATGKTISITAPASFWYLQYFPILALSSVIDYIVFMTYDLHGQWDYGNAYSDPGCSGGNCLRSHVNLTETINALSMITKAGVPSNMVAVGVASYARSFEMTTAGCWTDMCTYTGPTSGALPGPCTDTAGYLADYEIDLVTWENPTVEHYFEETSYSNILVYNETQWGAYMNGTNKATRKIIYESLNFLGTSDWAVDLQALFAGDNDTSSNNSSDSETIYIDPDIWNSPSAVVTAPPGATLIWPPKPLATTTTIEFPPWTTTISYSSLTTSTSTLTDGSTTTFPWYIYVPIPTVIAIPPVTTTAIPVWAVYLNSSSTGGDIHVTSSVQPPPFPVVVTPVMNGTISVINPTTTSTSTGGIFIWGDQTESLPAGTETIGSSTTVVGGTTLSATTTTVTPNPHPTTTQTTTDPALNSGSTGWKSGKTGSPTASAGCSGCGKSCTFGNTGSSSGNNPNPNDDSSTTGTASGTTSTGTSTAASATVYLAQTDMGDTMATVTPDLSVLASLESADISMWNSAFPSDQVAATTTTTSSTSTTQASTTSTTSAAPSPTAECYFWDEDLIAYQFKIFNIEGWATDGGASLHKQEDGCGALTFWTWYDATSTEDAYVYFDLPFFIKSGCVERAIVSAGGPKLSCKGQGTDFPLHKRSLDERASNASGPVPLPLTDAKLYALGIVYGNNTGSFQQYVPMNWTESGSS